MPKIRELGITVTPEGFGPVAVGAGGCGWTQQCTDCTQQPFSICGGTNQPCAGGTQQCFHGTIQPCAQWSGCSDCTFQPFSICGGTQQCIRGTFQCPGGSAQQCPIDTQCTSIACWTPVPVDPALTKAQIDQLKATLKQQLEALETHEKSLLPRTLEAIELREKEIAAELEQLKVHKAELSKKK